MGTVWEGVHATLGTRVAIKFIKPQFAEQAEARARFEIEARAAAKLQTKHAVHVFDYGVTADGLPYIVMEFLEGESLSDAIIAAARCPPPRSRRSSPRPRARSPRPTGRHRPPRSQARQHLPGADRRTSEGTPYVVKLVDFGIAKMFDQPLGDAAPSRTPWGARRARAR